MMASNGQDKHQPGGLRVTGEALSSHVGAGWPDVCTPNSEEGAKL